LRSTPKNCYSLFELNSYFSFGSFDVSDKAIEKRCKRLGVIKPPRGYWAKMQYGRSHQQALLALGWAKEKIETLGESLAIAEDCVRRAVSNP